MKKSKMLGKIWEVLYKETDLEEEGLKVLSEKILDTVEDSGMVVPCNDSVYCVGQCYCTEWEEE